MVERPHDFFVMYTDGSCSRNGSDSATGGWGVCVWGGCSTAGARVARDVHLVHLSKRGRLLPAPGRSVTNNRAELTAVLRAMQLFDELREAGVVADRTRLVLRTDSRYCVLMMAKLIAGRDVTGAPNEDLLARVARELRSGGRRQQPAPLLQHVEGHSRSGGVDAEGNDEADRLSRT
jgi:ribonuclease HI